MTTNLMQMGLEAQASSIGKTLADYNILKVPCQNCLGFMVDSQDRPCHRCDRGFVDVKRKIVEENKQS